MLYENKKTGEFGITLSELRSKFPNLSIPEGITALDDWTSYQEVARPYLEFGNVIEVKPVNGLQQWETNYNSVNKETVQVAIYRAIDDACATAIAEFSRFRAGYYAREEEAKQFISNDYSGVPGTLLKGFADSIGMTYKQASDLIMSQSEMLRKADITIEDLRMKKYTINYRQDTIDQMIQKRDEIISEIRSVAASVRG